MVSIYHADQRYLWPAAAIDNIADDPGILTRHARIAAASRKAITGAGLNLYLHSGYSSTVTVFEVPEAQQPKRSLRE